MAANPTYKAIFSNLENALLDSHRTMSAATRSALKTCDKKGLLIAYATCDSPQATIPVLTGNGVRGCIIAFGGALTVDETYNAVYERSMPRKTVVEVAQFIESCGIDTNWNVFTPTNWYTSDLLDQRVIAEEAETHSQAKQICISELPSQEKVYQVLCLVNPADVEALAQKARKAFPKLVVTMPTDDRIEIRAEGSTNLEAMKALCDARDIELDEVAAFVDDPNDVDLLKAAGLGVALANASTSVLDAATTIISDNDHSGIAHAIWEFVA